ncbi:hypothetical protein CLIB1444_23S00276 [[Candida] jaroonii]|uniref:Uncharacterized protein n=1 Tax=[Candida] jaroonii TaxID=467808 RepID=A0ACA9YGM7_9ASCO|nr:hypothetical protein CLIB1444_23S00276 [[Candida] jaroonii]
MSLTQLSLRYFPELHLLITTLRRYYRLSITWLYAQSFFIESKSRFFMFVNFICVTFTTINLQMIWLACHMITFASTFLLIGEILRYHRWNDHSYEVSICASTLTYLIVTTRHYRLLTGTKDHPMPITDLLRSDNTFLLALAMVALTSAPNPFKVVPFASYSLLNMYIAMIEEFFSDTLPATILRPYVAIVEQKVLVLCTMSEFVLFPIYMGEYLIRGHLHGLVYLLIMAMRLETSENVRTIARYVAEMITTMLAILGIDGSRLSEDVGILLPPARPKKVRVASLNFETIEVINDLN